MTDYRFETPGPVRLICEIGRGNVTVAAHETQQTEVEVSGPVADQVAVRHEGDEITIGAPRQRAGFFGGEAEVLIRVTLPHDSDAMIKTGSADISLSGPLATCSLSSGSGDIGVETLDAPSRLESGSGSISVGVANAELRVKSGSGDVLVDHAEGAIAVSTGSGDVRIETAQGPAAVKTGSGDLLVDDAGGDVAMSTGSGDMVVRTAHRGRITMRGASGDVLVGIPAGIPVWTDLSTLTGEIGSTLDSVGEPAEGADFVEVRAKTVSGDIDLRRV